MKTNSSDKYICTRKYLQVEVRENKNIYIPIKPLHFIGGYVLGIIRKDILTKESRRSLDNIAHKGIRLVYMAILRMGDTIAEINLVQHIFSHPDQSEFNIVDAGGYYVAVYYGNFMNIGPLLYNPNNPYVNYGEDILSNPPTLGSLIDMHDKENRYIHIKAINYYTISHISEKEVYDMLCVAFSIKGFSIFSLFGIDENYLVEAFYKACIEDAYEKHEACIDYRTPPKYHHVLDIVSKIRRRRKLNGSTESRIKE